MTDPVARYTMGLEPPQHDLYLELPTLTWSPDTTLNTGSCDMDPWCSYNTHITLFPWLSLFSMTLASLQKNKGGEGEARKRQEEGGNGQLLRVPATGEKESLLSSLAVLSPYCEV